MLEISTANYVFIGATITVLTSLLAIWLTWQSVVKHFDPLDKIWMVDQHIGDPCFSRVVRGLRALDRFHTDKKPTATFAELSLNQRTMADIERDALSIVSHSADASRLFMKTMKKMNYRINIYQADIENKPLRFEICGGDYTIVCKHPT